MTYYRKFNAKSPMTILPGKYFIIVFILLLSGCSVLCPYQQMEYSNVPQLKTFSDEMSVEEAINEVGLYVKDHQFADKVEDVKKDTTLPDTEITLKKGDMIAFRKIQENTSIDENAISYDLVTQCYKMIETEMDEEFMAPFKSVQDKFEGWEKTGYTGQFLCDEKVSYLIKYRDVKSIRLYLYKEIFNPTYKIYLYDKSDNMLFYFYLSAKSDGKQKVYRLLAALSILMPDAEEEYNEKDSYKIWPE